MSDPATIRFQTAAATGEMVDRLLARWRFRRARRAAERTADEQWAVTLAALNSEVHDHERASPS